MGTAAFVVYDRSQSRRVPTTWGIGRTEGDKLRPTACSRAPLHVPFAILARRPCYLLPRARRAVWRCWRRGPPTRPPAAGARHRGKICSFIERGASTPLEGFGNSLALPVKGDYLFAPESTLLSQTGSCAFVTKAYPRRALSQAACSATAFRLARTVRIGTVPMSFTYLISTTPTS